MSDGLVILKNDQVIGKYMDLIGEVEKIRSDLDGLYVKTVKQTRITNNVIGALVMLHQKHRIMKNYSLSDELRDLLNNEGIKIIQGTDGYAYDQIPEALKGHQINDVWEFER